MMHDAGLASGLLWHRDDAATLARGFAARGVAVLGPAAIAAPCFDRLCREAAQQRQAAAWTLSGTRAAGEIEQHNVRGLLGPEARRLLAAPDTADFLAAVTGLRLMPEWSASCYTYYDQPGATMGEHCDKADACHVAMLIYLQASWPDAERGPGPGLALRIHAGDNLATPLVAEVTARRNRVLVLYGSRQAHWRPALAEGEAVVAIAGCFRRAD